MAEFLEVRFPDDIDYGSGFVNRNANSNTITAGGDEYRTIKHPYQMLSLEVNFTRDMSTVISKVIDLYNRANGMFRGFRVYNYNDYSTNNYRGTPTAFDQALVRVSAGVYQLMRWYGSSSDPKCSRRRIRKPIANTTLVGAGGAVYPASQWTVDTTTGLVTCAANKSKSIAGITNAASAVIDVGTNAFNIGESVLITGISGMTQINGLRAPITAKPDSTHITVAINSSAFTPYTSGGVVNSALQASESVTGGCMFDIPMRFDTDLSGAFTSYKVLGISGVTLTEILNP